MCVKSPDITPQIPVSPCGNYDRSMQWLDFFMNQFLYQMSHACLQCFISVVLFLTIRLKFKDKIYTVAELLFYIAYYQKYHTSYSLIFFSKNYSHASSQGP